MNREEMLDGFALGGVLVLPRREQIVVDADVQHIEPRVMQVLVTLAERPQQPVSREELLQQVWSDAVVGDEVLSRAISLLRAALGDDRTNPRYIRTIPRLGYELIVTPERLPEKRRRRFVLPILGVLIAVGAVLSWWLARAPDAPRTVAVLPFEIQDQGDDLAVLREALVVDVHTLLEQAPNLRGVSRRASFALRDPETSDDMWRTALQADFLLDGVLATDSSGLVATLYLVDGENNLNLWSGKAEAATAEALQQAVVSEVRDALETHGSAAFTRTPRQLMPLNEQAFRLYLEARYQWSLRGAQRIGRARQLLEESIRLDPEFAEAHLALAHVLATQPFYTDMEVLPAIEHARGAMKQAVELAPGLATEAAALEGAMLLRERRWAEAGAQLDAALSADPENVQAHYWKAILLAQQGRFADSLLHAERAVELDPLSPVLNDRLAVSCMWVNNLSRAQAQYAKAAELGYMAYMQPKSYVMYLARAGRFEEIGPFLVQLGLPRQWAAAFVAALENPDVLSAAVAHTQRAIADGSLPRDYHFGVWVLLGQGDAALEAFDLSLKSPDVELLWSPEAHNLRNSDGFDALLSDLGLSDKAI